MAIYKDDKKSLSELLELAGDEEEGATLLIPDLQRPYIWKPLQVTILVDSLIRGWPFGTLLTWKVSAKDPARALARAFRRVVDRTTDDDESDEERISAKHPPASFHMVLDGQQRVQSLLLAFQSGSWGFKLHDADWQTELTGGKQRTATGAQRWSLGCLCVDLQALSEEYAQASRLVEIDFQKVLCWAITDSATGQSGPVSSTYVGPLPRTDDPANVGRFIRLSRLWKRAPELPGAEHRFVEGIARELLTEHQAGLEKVSEVTALLFALRDVKQTSVTYLELAGYSEAIHGSLDSYNDAVVNIFTRLNTAGRTLTREDITFAWLKVGWNVQATGGRTAGRCFRELGEVLEESQLWLSNEDLVSAVSFVWSVSFNKGKLLGNNDLLKGEAIRPMAEDVSGNWSLVVEAMTRVSALLKDRRLEFGVHYQSLNAVQILWAWYFAAASWQVAHPHLNEPQKDRFEQHLLEALDEFVDRWLICSQWAGRWASGTAATSAGLASRLADCADALSSQTDVAGASALLRSHLEAEVRSLETDALAYLANMRATNRKQVRTYYTALWIWNRLDRVRWQRAKVALREKTRAGRRIEVDHVVAYSLWDKKIQPLLAQPTPAGGEGIPAVPSPNAAEYELAINELGNCLLLEKNFNISKKGQPLLTFFSKLHDFQPGKQSIEDWAQAMSLEMGQVDCASAAPAVLQQLFSARSQKIRGELENFVRGARARVDLEELVTDPNSTPAGPPTSTGKPKRGMDKSKLATIARVKERLAQPPYSEHWKAHGAVGGHYWVPISLHNGEHLWFGVNEAHPYLAVPNNKGYAATALQGDGWSDDVENDARSLDLGAVDLNDAVAVETLIDRVLVILESIRSASLTA